MANLERNEPNPDTSKAKELPKFPRTDTWFDGHWEGGYTGGEYPTQLQLCSDEEGRISGVGDDAAGRFIVEGYYDVNRQWIKFFKHYSPTRVAQYNGFFDGQRIVGFWFLDRQVGNFVLSIRLEDGKGGEATH